MQSSATRPRLYWKLQLISWGLYGVFGGLLVSLFSRFSTALVFIEIIIAITLLTASHLLRRHIHRRGWLRLSPAALSLRLLLALLLLSTASIVVIALLTILYFVLTKQPDTGKGFPWLQYFGYWMNVFFVLSGWSAVYFGWHYFEGYRSAEIDRWKLAATAREAEMRTLKAQLNPHFLFNGLNNIRALVMEDPTRARAMMTHLAELLRYSIQRSGAEQVPLATELEIVEDYLQLEAMQLEERLRYSFDVAPEALTVSLPPMTLQLLVENGIKHGLSPRPAGGSINLSAWLETPPGGSPQLRVAVRNTGTYQPPPDHPGVGVRNVRERLALLFGPAARFTLGPDLHQPDTVLADLYLPLTPSPPLYERALG